MNGALIPHTPIAVDNWFVRTCKNSRLFFLSHAHTDHTQGLKSSWKTHKIYCSEVTKEVVMHKLGVREELLVGLPVGEAVVLPMDEEGKENLTVTLIDANHCPGAVMFLFEGYFGTVFYTGDFRFDEVMLTHPALQGKTIDKLFLDNTYCNPKCSFPSRTEATNKILKIIGKHLEHNIVIGMNTLGKEELLVKIGVAFETWIGVSPQRMELLKLLGLPDVFTCETEKARIKVVMRREVTKTNLQMWNAEHPTIAILPTALFEGERNPYKYMADVFVVPLSDHSSFQELVDFVSELKPKESVPLVLRNSFAKGDPNDPRINMSIFSEFLSKEPLSPITIPDSVLRFMSVPAENKERRKRTVKPLVAPRIKRRKCCGVVFEDVDKEQVGNCQRNGLSLSDLELGALSNGDISKHEEKGSQNGLACNKREKVKEEERQMKMQKIHVLPGKSQGCSLVSSSKVTPSETLKIQEQCQDLQDEAKKSQQSAMDKTDDKMFTKEPLQHFNWGNYENKYAERNPLFKKCTTKICDYFKEVAAVDEGAAESVQQPSSLCSDGDQGSKSLELDTCSFSSDSSCAESITVLPEYVKTKKDIISDESDQDVEEPITKTKVSTEFSWFCSGWDSDESEVDTEDILAFSRRLKNACLSKP